MFVSNAVGDSTVLLSLLFLVLLPSLAAVLVSLVVHDDATATQLHNVVP